MSDRLEELRQLRESLAARLSEKVGRASQLAEGMDEKTRFNWEAKKSDIVNRHVLMARKSELDEAREVRKAGEAADLERLRHDLRQAERMPNFEDYRMRAELDFLVRKAERRDGELFENAAMERRITELRNSSRQEIKKLFLSAIIDHLTAEARHGWEMERLAAESDNALTAAELAHAHRMEADRQAHFIRTAQEGQAHGHRIAQDDNASRLRMEELTHAKFVDYVFARIGDGGKVMGHSREDVEALIAELERGGGPAW